MDQVETILNWLFRISENIIFPKVEFKINKMHRQEDLTEPYESKLQ